MKTFEYDYWMNAYPDKLQRLAQGKVAQMDGKLYVVCRECWKVIRLNKPLVGSLHFCTEK